MRLSKMTWGCSLFSVLILLFTGSHVAAQTTADGASAAQTSAVPARITQPIDETQLVTLKGSVHPLARPEFDQGAAPDSQPMKRMMLVLRRSPDQQAALSKLMYEQAIKDSPNYHEWLTPQEFGQQFGASDADIAKVTEWLGSKGFSEIKVSNGRVTIEFSGNVGQVRSAFHTDIHRFLVSGEIKQANTSDPKLPVALTPVVAGIASLHNFYAKSTARVHAAQGSIVQTPGGKSVPQFSGNDARGAFFAVGPGDFAKIYNVPSALNGTGGKIAIIGLSDINPADVDAQRALFGLPAKNLNIVLNGGDPGFGNEESEAALDVQASGSVATQAEIDYILSEGTLTADPTVLGAEYVIDNNSDDVMSLSFSTCEPNLTTAGQVLFADLWEEGAAQGISVVLSAGDGGAAGCDNFDTQTSAMLGIAVNGFASTPFNIAVGGTDFDDAGTQVSGGFWSSTNGTGLTSANGYIHEIPLNNSCGANATPTNLAVCATPDNIFAGSGGPSVNFLRPSFQSGIVPNGIVASDAPSHRFLPDVSLFASDGPKSRSFYVVCEADANASCVSSGGTFSFLEVGGTSASAPSFAGILALVGQSEFNAGRSRRLGNANLVLYNLAATAANSCNSQTNTLTPPAGCIFNDVTKGTSAVPCAGGSVNCSNTSPATGQFGVLVTETNIPAFTTAAGYDLATGLGSVNVANLASKWHAATLSATTASTKVNNSTSAVTITHGTSVTLSATVTSGGGTPTGDVSFPVPMTPGGGTDCPLQTFLVLGSTCTPGFVTLSGGTGSQATTSLPGGHYNLKAHYGGDVNFAPTDDPTGVSVTVNPEASTLQVGIVTFDPTSGNITSTNATGFAYGSPYILRADILNSTGNTTNCQPLASGGVVTGCALNATGKVTLTDNGAPLDGGTFNVNSEGSFEDQIINLTGGSHTVVGTYSGDNSYSAPAASVTLNLNVAKAMTATVVMSNVQSVATNASVTLTVNITTQSVSNVGPTGTVTFSSNGTPIGSPVTVVSSGASTSFAGGTATLTTSFASAGTKSITATYNGDTNYALSNATAISLTVTGGGSYTVSGTAATVAAGSMGSSTITVTPSGGFTSSGVGITCSGVPGVSCGALNIAVPGPGAATGTLSISVTAPSSSMTASNIQAERTYVAQAAIPQTGNKGGWWTLSGGTGLAAMLLLFLPGRKRIRAALGLSLVCVLSFAMGCGGGSHTTTMTQTTTTLTVSSTKVASGGMLTVSAMVTGGTPTGTVQFVVDGTAAGSPVSLNNGSTGNITVTGLNAAVGTHALVAMYSGSSTTQASHSGMLEIAVTGTTQVTVTGTSGGTMASGNVSLTIN